MWPSPCSTSWLALSNSVCWRGVRWFNPVGLSLSRTGPGASIPFDPILATEKVLQGIPMTHTVSFGH